MPKLLRPIALGLLLVGPGLSTYGAQAFDGPRAEAVSGAWEISDVDGLRKCRILLRADTVRDGEHMIGMPAGCRRAFPVLGDAGGWKIADQKITLASTTGQTVLAFAPGEESRLVATGPNGEIYELEPLDRARTRVAQAAPPAAATPSGTTTRPTASPGIRRVPSPGAPAATTPTAAAPVAAAAAAPADAPSSPVVAYPGRGPELAGRYNILREADKDMGCLLTLDGTARGPGGSKAQLAPACRDQGIVVFDPVSWRVERGHLMLRARKGHDARFLYHADGVWRKDPKEGGKPLGLKRI